MNTLISVKKNFDCNFKMFLKKKRKKKKETDKET